MGKFRVIITVLLIACQSCAYMPRKVTIQDCINLTGEVIATFCLKPKDMNHEKTKEEISDEITRQYAETWKVANDPKDELIKISANR